MSEFIQAEARQQFERRRQQHVAAQEKHEQQARRDDMPLATITCGKCSRANPAGHRFCRACGASVWKVCPGCSQERPIDEAFCAACGTNLLAHEQQLAREYQQRLSEVEQLVATHRYADALRTLRAIVDAQLPTCPEEVRTAAATLLNHVTAQHDEMVQRCAVHCAQAQQLLNASQYEAAVHELESIPDAMRDAQVQELLARAAAQVREIARLKRIIQTATGIGIEERMSCLDRLLALLPDDEQVAGWAAQVRDRLVQIARRRLNDHQYRQAVELLKMVPAPTANKAVSELARQASELDYLWSEIELAPTLSPSTLQAAQRLVKLAPGNALAQHKLQEMLRRQQAARERPGGASLEWVPCPPHTPIGLPVHAYFLPDALALTGAAVRHVFAEQAGRLLVACGLALQAIAKAHVTTNLLPPRRAGVLGSLRASMRVRPATAGWGLDLSTSGLKAVRIAAGADGRPTITHAACIAHRLPLTHPSALPIKQDLLRETLSRFLSDHEVASTDRVAVSWPALHSLVRFLTLPSAEGKKWRDMLELETRQQIPMPLDLVVRDTFTFPPPGGGARPGPDSVLLVAVRRKDIEEHLSLFESTKIDVQTVQCDAVALHNFLHFDRLAIGTDPPVESQCTALAALDVGVESTNLLVSSHQALWFRSLRPAGDDLVSALAQRFRLTRDMAHEVLLNPAKAKPMGEVYQECCQVFERLTEQVGTCLQESARTGAPDAARTLFLLGGAGMTPGLLRYLRYGR